MLLKIQTKSSPYMDIGQHDDSCCVYQTDVFEVVFVGQIFNDLSAYHNAAHYFLERIVKQPRQIVDEIDGYYGVIILDKTTASVEVYRDPIGMQPLYYAIQSNEYLFSSTLKGIKKTLPNASHSEEFFLKYLEEMVPNTYELTMYEGIFRVNPNSKYVLNNGKITERNQLFNFEGIAIQNRTDEEAIELFQRKLERAVANYFKEHKDLFFQYTGGLDSTGILTVSRFLRGNTQGFHTYIHQYFPDHQSFDEMHIVKKLHQTEGLPLPHYTPETHFESLDAEVAYGKENHTLMIINQVLDSIYIDMNQKKGRVLFSGFGGDECITFNQNPRFFTNQLKDFQLSQIVKSIKAYGIKHYLSQLIKTDLRIYLLKIFFPQRKTQPRFSFREASGVTNTFRQVHDTHGYIRYMLSLPRVAYRIEEEKEMAANYHVELAYPWLDFQLLCYFLSLKENQLIFKQKGRFFYKNALRKYIKSEWYFNYRKAESVIVGESMFKNESELDAQLLSQYDKLPLFIKKYDFKDALPKQHKSVKEILLGRLSKLSVWLRN
jgi:asparagine synthetase B (glutamine-hydrolysing)